MARLGVRARATVALVVIGVATMGGAGGGYCGGKIVNPDHNSNGPPIPPPPPPPPPPQPPPPPPPAPPIPASTDYVVYFGFDEAAVTPEADSLLAKAAQDVAVGAQDAAAVRQGDSDYEGWVAQYKSDWNSWRAREGTAADKMEPVTDPKDLPDPARYVAHETIVGHTDTAGTTAYNQRLSERRAKAGADALVAKGVPPETLSVSGKGETDPAVATGDGVREPLNRRVTIHIGY
jgi:outer membrane protein OmpA-like peptidoglycan-associated protein